MNRRTILRWGIWGSVGVIAGCGQPVEDGEPDPYITISAKVIRLESDWKLSATVRNDTNREVSVHNVTLIAYSDDGTEVCRERVGDFLQDEPASRSVDVKCKEFPAIITVTAEESPCDGTRLQIDYWIGTDDQRGKDLDEEEIVWESTYQECGESLPPERVLQNVSTGG